MKMMLAVFASLSLALLAAYLGPRWLAIVSMLLCLALSVGRFVFELANVKSTPPAPARFWALM
jgi:hypothetical protein